MKRFTLILLALFCIAHAHAAERHDSIPKDFLGKWSTDLDRCKSEFTDLTISPNHLYYYESDGPAISIVTYKKKELALILLLTGEGEEWLSLAHFKLSPDKKRLTDISDPNEEKPFVWHRCP